MSVLAKSSWTTADLDALLDSAIDLEALAQLSHQMTTQRFGRTIQIFVPMYLSNECYNRCTYCGFSLDHKYPRKTLTDAEMMLEFQTLKSRGFHHLLLLTGEAPGKVDADYIEAAVKKASSIFDSVGIEVQPFDQPTYEALIAAGADSLSLYQETYHKPTYLTHHLSGKKRNYEKRLAAVEAGAKAGFHRINLGALLGLYDWRYEANALAEHVDRMQRTYWQTQLGVSFPRIQDMVGEYDVRYQISDREFVQLICAFRLIFPDLAIILSTRESAELRDNLIKLGVTHVSAESKTNPGGYNGADSEEQFSTADHRDLASIKSVISHAGYEPVMKDWQVV